MLRAAVFSAALLTSIAATARAQSGDAAAHLEAGIAALDVGDPKKAIAEFERVDVPTGYAWLAAALMMESRSPSDGFVERAFDAAAKARSRGARSVTRREIVSAMRPGDLVVASLVGEKYAFAWSFDATHLAGYPLPAPAQLAAAADRASAYAARNDREGLKRIADDVMPALLVIPADQLQHFSRVIFVLDGPLARLPIAAMPAGNDRGALQDRFAITVSDYDSVLDAVKRETATPQRDTRSGAFAVASVIALILVVGGAVLLRRRRASVA